MTKSQILKLIERRRDAAKRRLGTDVISDLNAFDGRWLSHPRILSLRDLGEYQSLDNVLREAK